MEREESIDPSPPKCQVQPLSKWIDQHGFNNLNRVNIAVFKPIPGSIEKSFNTWGGFTWTRNEVKDYKNWKILSKFFLHLRFGWCDSDEQCIRLISRFIGCVQRPWEKQEVLCIVNGGEGTYYLIIDFNSIFIRYWEDSCFRCYAIHHRRSLSFNFAT